MSDWAKVFPWAVRHSCRIEEREVETMRGLIVGSSAVVLSIVLCVPAVAVESDEVIPPYIRITEAKADSNVMLKSTGTNDWGVLPFYTTNVMANPILWLPVTNFLNQYLDGTNTTWFDYPPHWSNTPHLYFKMGQTNSP